MKNLRIVLLICILVFVVNQGICSSSLMNKGALGISTTYYPEFKGDLYSMGVFFWGMKPSMGFSLDFELGGEAFGGKNWSSSDMSYSIGSITGSLFYPILLGEKAVLNAGAAVQWTYLQVSYKKNSLMDIGQWALMPHLSFNWSLDDHDGLAMKLTWIPKLGDSGVGVLRVGVMFPVDI